MISLQKIGDSAVKFVFTDSDHYLYGNGEIEVPVNSLLLVIDESDMVTFKKLSGDPFLSFRADNSNLGTKAAIEQFYKDNMVGSTGGGSGSGVTPSEVQEMIDESISGKADTSDVTAVANDVQTVSGQVATKVAITDFNAYSATTDARIAEDEEVTAAALNNLDENKQDALTAGQGIDITNNVISSTVNITVDPTLDTGSTNPVANSAITNAINAKQDALYIYTEDNNLGTAELHSNDSSIIFNAGGASITANNAMGVNTFNVASTGVTINGDRVLTESDGVYYINFATLTTQGIHDADWDGIVNAINAHRPIYAGLPGANGLLYYTAECLYQDGSNTIKMTASDHNSHYFYTFTKNGSEDYSYTVSTKPYVPDITTAITSGSTDDEIPTAKAVYDATQSGGGGATYSAGTNISIDTANTINCTLPITANTNNLQGYLLFGSNISVWGSESNGRYQIAIGKQISNPAYAQGQVAICPADTSSSSLSELTGEYPIGIGHMITSRGNGAVAIGDTANANGNGYVAIGQRANATGTTKMNLNNQIKVDTNNQVYIKDKTNTTDVCIQDAIAALGGLKFVKLTQAEYSAMEQAGTLDNSTLYIVSNVVS